MERVFQIFFFTGAIFTVASFLLGQFASVGGGDTGIDLDMDGEVDVEFDSDYDVTGSPFGRLIALRPSTIAAFVTVFGGMGMIAGQKGYSLHLTLAWSLGLGLLSALAITHLVINPLQKAQNTSAIPQAELIGWDAVVTLGMEGKSFGQIAYSANHNIYTAPAKSKTGRKLYKGDDVTIAEIDRGVFYVKRRTQKEEK